MNPLSRRAHPQLWVILSLFILIASCSDDPLSGDQPFRKAEQIAERLQEQLDGKVMGYSLAISHEGTILVERSGGMARNESDQAREFRTEDKLHIGQTSQFITAVAVLRFLRDNQMSVDDSIADFLPDWWERGDNLNQVTFRNLLDHTSGFTRPGSQRVRAASLDSLRIMIRNGVENESTFRYSHQNYAMMRILIPQIIDQSNRTLGPQPVDFDYGFVFREYLRKELFPAAGMDGDVLQTTQLVSDAPLAYYGPEDNGFGYGHGWNYILISGAFGFYLNAAQLSSFWNLFWYGDRLLNESEKEFMKSERIGFDPLNGTTADRAWIKSGSWVYASNQEGLTKRVESFAGHFPDGWDLVILTNSPHADEETLTDIALKAFFN